MPDPARRTPDEAAQPPGVEGEGLDPYPTYRDGPVPPHRATASKPTDVGLPHARRTRPGPMLIGLITFAAIVLFYLVWVTVGVDPMTDDAPTGAATQEAPAASSPSDGSQPVLGEERSGADGDAGPGEVGPAPEAIDVPGGATTGGGAQ